MSKYYSINEFSKILGVLAKTLRNLDVMETLSAVNYKINVLIKQESL